MNFLGLPVAPSIFSGTHLSDWLAERRREVEAEIANCPAQDLLVESEDQLVDRFVDRATVPRPTIQRDRAHLPGPPIEVMVSNPNLGAGPKEVRGTRYTLVVPIAGHPYLFRLMVGGGHPVAPAQVKRDSIELWFEGPRPDAAEVQRRFDEALATIERNLILATAKIDAFNAALDGVFRPHIVARRAKLNSDRNVQQQLAFPIRRRPDADAQAVPVQRRVLVPNSPNHATHGPDARVLLDRDYEEVLTVLQNMRNAFERSPSTAARMDEEMMRDVLLIGLNARFQGNAAGEVFNCEGKTDILVRVEDRNVFIGECKIIDRRHKKAVTTQVQAALDKQLLRYLAWRDTKGALLLFIRDQPVTTVITAAAKAIAAHPNCVERGAHATDERHDFVLHALDDPERLIQLALVPIAVPEHRPHGE